jgi:hypothetical protein
MDDIQEHNNCICEKVIRNIKSVCGRNGVGLFKNTVPEFTLEGLEEESGRHQSG